MALHFKQRGSRGRGRGQRQQYGNLSLVRRAVSQMSRQDFASNDIDIEMERDPEFWWKVTVLFGSKYPRQWLHEQLQNIILGCASARPFFNWCVEDKNVAFYMRLRKSQLGAFRTASQRVQAADGQNLVVNVAHPRGREPSIMHMSDAAVEALKAALVRRWKPETGELDLSRLYEDAELQSSGHYLPLNQLCVVTGISQIISDNAPPVTRLQLAGNKLFSLEGFKGLLTALTATLRQVNITDNNLRHESFADVFKIVPITHIEMKNNPILRVRDEDAVIA